MATPITITESQYLSYQDNYIGLCLECNAERDSTEPDAENYECYSCGAHKVMGIELALIAGNIVIGDD
jgi:hypothetical protein